MPVMGNKVSIRRMLAGFLLTPCLFYLDQFISVFKKGRNRCVSLDHFPFQEWVDSSIDHFKQQEQKLELERVSTMDVCAESADHKQAYVE